MDKKYIDLNDVIGCRQDDILIAKYKEKRILYSSKTKLYSVWLRDSGIPLVTSNASRAIRWYNSED